ncbi:MAG: glycosyltransferase [Gammaproteobacteria bacterium]|nr:glycosyltransferase [Gammaproteobacteria bacterium]MYK45026.1 glycosyltransferase [Gammaproteobacteria bacterium]
MIPPILTIAYSALIGHLLWKRDGRSGPQATPCRNEEAGRRQCVSGTGEHDDEVIARDTTKRDSLSAAKVRTAIYTGSLYNRSMMNLARGLADRGFDVDFVVNEADGLYDEIPNPEQVFSLVFRYLRLNRWLRPRSWFGMSALVPRLLDYLRRRQPTVLLKRRADDYSVAASSDRFEELIRTVMEQPRLMAGKSV